MSPSSMHDLPVAHIDAAHHRREAASQKSKEMKPWCTRDPLSHDREKKPAAQSMKKRKRVMPTTPALTFDPKRNHVPSGKQEPPASPSVYPGPPASDSSESSYDEQHPTSFSNREMHDQFHNGHDAQKRPRIFPEYPSTELPASFYPDATYAEGSKMDSVPPPDFYDSPVSYAAPPALSDSSYAAELPFQVIQPMYSYGGLHQSVVHQDFSYLIGHYPDRPAQGHPMQYPEPAYGRPAPHGVPAYPDDNGCPYTPGRR